MSGFQQARLCQPCPLHETTTLHSNLEGESMKPMTSVLYYTWWASTFSLLVAGCGAPPNDVEHEDNSRDPDAQGNSADGTLDPSVGNQLGHEEQAIDDKELTLEIEGKFNAYAQALLDNDLELLTTIMSTEVQERVAKKGPDMGAFAEKLRRSMIRHFNTMAENTMTEGERLDVPFSVVEMRAEGDALRVEVARAGKPLAKPFYFVLEGDDYKLNLLRPGFSKPLPEGAGAAYDTYLLKNQHSELAIGDCAGNNPTWIPGNSQQNKSCSNTCGWWSGSTFYGHWPYSLKCDWNTWGVDVYYHPSYSIGLECNDTC